ncbi:hypothetical protein ScalyP_jg10751 [Parmales sp. scaly parma]|nr:hypothetical protein ScalyP_jg10751 [Parmales sp. scaly parma]
MFFHTCLSLKCKTTAAVSDSLLGPFEYVETLFSTFHHNPRLVVDPATNKYLLFMIGGSLNGTDDCNLRTPHALGLRKRLAPRSGPRRAPGGTGQPSIPTRARSPKTTGPAQRPPEGPRRDGATFEPHMR